MPSVGQHSNWRLKENSDAHLYGCIATQVAEFTGLYRESSMINEFLIFCPDLIWSTHIERTSSPESAIPFWAWHTGRAGAQWTHPRSLAKVHGTGFHQYVLSQFSREVVFELCDGIGDRKHEVLVLGRWFKHCIWLIRK